MCRLALQLGVAVRFGQRIVIAGLFGSRAEHHAFAAERLDLRQSAAERLWLDLAVGNTEHGQIDQFTALAACADGALHLVERVEGLHLEA